MKKLLCLLLVKHLVVRLLNEQVNKNIGFAMVFSITHCCVNFIKTSCYSICSRIFGKLMR